MSRRAWITRWMASRSAGEKVSIRRERTGGGRKGGFGRVSSGFGERPGIVKIRPLILLFCEEGFSRRAAERRHE